MILYLSVAGEGKWVGSGRKKIFRTCHPKGRGNKGTRSTNLILFKLKINGKRLLNTTINFVITFSLVEVFF